ncbi:unnamed protein product [Schistosoma mattheei]|uniref:Uncharacterized protein n=1 Tax=Schistosoma mattheei TaxID=31246 RepID=A0A183PIG0_9TREM|nr:unnamed protein product [Schistosoma mattheei]
MLLLHNYILFILYLIPYIYCIGRGFFKLSSNSYNEWNPSTQLSSSSIGSSISLPYSSDTNSYAYWNCHTIPPNMTLCKSVGYSRMVLPNFLHHESLREAIQQANVWIALVNTDCHPDIQRFLCSLYAPVCLKSHQEAKIPPCWELCNQVRNACLPRMKLFGFDWPDIVHCQQFPRLAEKQQQKRKKEKRKKRKRNPIHRKSDIDLTNLRTEKFMFNNNKEKKKDQSHACLVFEYSNDLL